MAHLHFNLRKLIAGMDTHPAVSQPTLTAPDCVDEAELPGGPGWFDSSWELNRGLDVREALPCDARLNDWLDVYLRSGRDADARSDLGSVGFELR